MYTNIVMSSVDIVVFLATGGDMVSFYPFLSHSHSGFGFDYQTSLSLSSFTLNHSCQTFRNHFIIPQLQVNATLPTYCPLFWPNRHVPWLRTWYFRTDIYNSVVDYLTHWPFFYVDRNKSNLLAFICIAMLLCSLLTYLWILRAFPLVFFSYFPPFRQWQCLMPSRF